jgi:hypothetical protein
MYDARTPEGVWVRDLELFEVDGPQSQLDAAILVAGASGGRNWAILEITPHDVPFQIGWTNQYSPTVERYSIQVEPLKGLIAMRVDKDRVHFVARALDGVTKLTISLVAKVTEDDHAFSEIPHY